MSEVQERLAANVVTSENLAEFNSQRLNLATREAPAAAAEETPAEPVAATEQSGQDSEEKEATAVEESSKPNKLEKRFTALTKQREEARQDAERERAAREVLESKVRELEGRSRPQAEPAAATEEPQPSQFSDAFEYAKALAEFSTERALRNRDRQDAERKAAVDRDKVIETWNTRLSAAKADLPDFDDMVASSDVQVSDQVRDAILDSDVGPKILYHLAEHTDLATKLAGMSTASALREIGKLEARFEAKVETKPLSTVGKSKAPPPINPIRGGGTGTDVKIDSNGEFHGDYQSWRAARMAGKIR